MNKQMMMLIRVVALSVSILLTFGCNQDATAEEIAQPNIATESTQTPAQESDSAGDTVAVTVNDQKIMASTIAEEMKKRIDVMKTRMPAGQELPEAQVKQMHTRLVDSLVEQALIEQMAKEKNVKVTDEKVMDQLKQIAGEQNQTMEEVEAEIKGMGMTLEDIKGQIHTQMLSREIMDTMPVTEEEEKAFYNDNPQYFDKPEQVRARHILIMFEPDASDEDKAKAREKIEGLLKRAKAGEDFAELAKEYTEDPGSKEAGGEYTFPRGQMVKPFEDTAFSLKVGEISDVVETQYGYHIIKLLEKIEAGKIPFEDEQEKIKTYLKGQKYQEAQQAYHAKAKITYSEEEEALRKEMEELSRQQAEMMQQMRQSTGAQQQGAQQIQPQPAQDE